MPLSLLPTLLLQILVIGYTPGPANIYSLTVSLRHKRKDALIMWLGLLLGFSISVTVMAIFTHFVGFAFGSYVGYLKYIGGAYILYLAYNIWRSNKRPEGSVKDCTFSSGMIVQLTNAKMLLFDLTAFSTFVLPYSNHLSDLFEVGAWLTLAGPGGNLAWLLIGSYLHRLFNKYKHQINIISALALAACAIYIIL